MAASVAIDAAADLIAISAAAGNADPQGRYYRDGRLYVQGVSQQALEAALAEVGTDPVIPVPDLTPLQMSLGLLAAGMLTEVEALVAAGPPELRLAWTRASVIQRHHPMTLYLMDQIGLSAAAADHLFRTAAAG